MIDFKQGKGPEGRAEWGFVVLAGPEAGKRIVENTSFSFFSGGAKGDANAATAYKWARALKFKGQAPPADYLLNSDDVIGRVASGTVTEDARGYMHVSKDLLPCKALPDSLTLDAINAIMDQARVDHTAWEAERGNAAGGDGAYFGDPNAALTSAAMADADIPF